jgi:hypothetical protein
LLSTVTARGRTGVEFCDFSITRVFFSKGFVNSTLCRLHFGTKPTCGRFASLSREI